MHSYPVVGRENFPRQNLTETIAEPVFMRKNIEWQWLIRQSEAKYCKRKVFILTADS